MSNVCTWFSKLNWSMYTQNWIKFQNFTSFNYLTHKFKIKSRAYESKASCSWTHKGSQRCSYKWKHYILRTITIMIHLLFFIIKFLIMITPRWMDVYFSSILTFSLATTKESTPLTKNYKLTTFRKTSTTTSSTTMFTKSNYIFSSSTCGYSTHGW